MSTAIHRQVEACRAGTLPRVISRLRSGWLVMGDPQFLRGYCLILPDPVVPSLNALGHPERQGLMLEASVVGDALLGIVGATRINYEILGNLEPALHVHVFPRFDDEPRDMRTRPVWFYDWSAGPAFDPERDRPLMQEIRRWVKDAGITG